MKYLEAKKVLRNSEASVECNVLLACSSQTENLSPYLEAYAALKGEKLSVQRLEFGVLEQHLRKSETEPEKQILLLYPWDFCRHLDWRMSQSETSFAEEEALTFIDSFCELLSSVSAPFFYVDVDPPSTQPLQNIVRKIRNHIRAQIYSLGGEIISSRFFSFMGYLDSGMAISNKHASELAQILSAKITGLLSQAPIKKVVISDLDNTLWQGVIGEDGPNNVLCEVPGESSLHYHYQNYLRSLGESGILLIAVSKNDLDLALKTFNAINMPLSKDDFYEIIADYEEKHLHIEALSKELDLPLNSFVFVDDNPVEIAKVTTTLPEVQCLQFPAENIDTFPEFMQKIRTFFPLSVKTAEDKERKQLYKQRKMANAQRKNSASIEDYLSSLDMKMQITNSTLNTERAFQLINKTNQFNLNGRRLEQKDFDTVIEDGYQVITAKLSDRFGDHGEILSCLVSPTDTVSHWVMSCRVLQRRVEHSFLTWLLNSTKGTTLTLAYQSTERNTPFRNFLNTVIDQPDSTESSIELNRYATIELLSRTKMFIEIIEDRCIRE